jgi:hypothetical protein
MEFSAMPSVKRRGAPDGLLVALLLSIVAARASGQLRPEDDPQAWDTTAVMPLVDVGGGQDAITWLPKAEFPAAGRSRGMSCVKLGDTSYLYALGGRTADSIVASCFRYDPNSDVWSPIAPLPEKNTNQWAVWWSDDGVGSDSSGIFVLGRYDSGSFKTCYRWTEADDTWSAAEVPEYPGIAESGNMAAVVGDSVFLIHRNSDSTTEFHCYSIREGTWSARPTPVCSANYYGTICSYAGRIWQLGGWHSSTDFQSYDPGTHQWTRLASPYGVGGNSAMLFGCLGRIWACGGGSGWTPWQAAASFDTVTQTWNSESPLPNPVLAAFAGVLGLPDESGLHLACGRASGGVRYTLHYRGEPGLPGVGEVRGVQQNGRDVGFTPNPYVRWTTAAGFERQTFTVRDASGRRVAACAGNRVGSDLAPGVYFVSGACMSQSRPARIVKIR